MMRSPQAPQISVPISLTADNADVLSGTQLDPIPYTGVLEIYLASTQADTTLTVSVGKELMINARPLPQRTNGQPAMSDDPAWQIPVNNGQRAVLNVDVVTAATVRGHAVLVPG